MRRNLYVIVALCCLFLSATAAAQQGKIAAPKKAKPAAEAKQGGSPSKGVGVWVDLGLPSGTLWKDRNERMCNWKDARSRYAKQLPTLGQFDELLEYCETSVEGEAIRFTGPNGNSIVLPAEGRISCKGNIEYEGTVCNYWLLGGDLSEAWYYDFDFPDLGTKAGYYKHCYGRSVRLVKGGSR